MKIYVNFYFILYRLAIWETGVCSTLFKLCVATVNYATWWRCYYKYAIGVCSKKLPTDYIHVDKGPYAKTLITNYHHTTSVAKSKAI